MVLFIKLILSLAAVFLSALILSYFTSVPYLRYPDLQLPFYRSKQSNSPRIPKPTCDIFHGEWVPDPGYSPEYTNETCSYIQEYQNCFKYGRPDSEFLRWRWQPSQCDLPRFDAGKFLRLVRGKTLAFVGDSLSRNHMQSLLCLLSKVALPKEVSMTGTTDERNKILYYEDYRFTIKILWSPFLVRTEDAGNDIKLYLDEPDAKWLSGVAGFDYMILSGANWFTRPTLFYEKGQLVGGSYVAALNMTSNLTLLYSHRMAFRTALRAINGHGNVKGKVIVRTMSPMSHFEGGSWDKGGDCSRTRPYRSNETTIEGQERDMYTAQVEEFMEAKKAAAAAGVDMALMDSTGAMLLRPDGHPSRYGHWPDANWEYKDCIHWCLPGPVDAWSDMLFHMMSD